MKMMSKILLKKRDVNDRRLFSYVEKYDIIVMCVIARIWLSAETVRQPQKQENNIRIL